MSKPNQINCLIVDDQEIFRVVLRNMVGLDPSLTLVGECDSATGALEIIRQQPIDLLFLDIEMPEMSGIEFAQALDGKGPLIIFTTFRIDMAIQAFDLNVVDFLVKPIATVRFLKAVDKARARLKIKDPDVSHINEEFIFIRESNVIRNIKFSDILYLESLDNYVKIHLKSQTYLIHSALKSVELKLSSEVFIRVHRSFIINLSKIDSIDNGILVINKNLVPVSDTYRAALNKRIQFL